MGLRFWGSTFGGLGRIGLNKSFFFFWREMMKIRQKCAEAKPTSCLTPASTASGGTLRPLPAEEGVTPSAPTPGLRSSSESANARALAQASMDDHRCCHACRARSTRTRGTERALALANWLTKARASSDQRPPTSAARTTRRVRPWWPESSG